ncbi:hypothetical protein C4D60_Mb09t22490 [Musa balbisiana]|uniref:Uncharacterized protein n=1 Tax=Musa balbisiana TaxID=52838 RepID=A0A4S8IID3_MUSBA|nr:hypothetical protein C4D60_Mb09t22490 [Musa balbisiana]
MRRSSRWWGWQPAFCYRFGSAVADRRSVLQTLCKGWEKGLAAIVLETIQTDRTLPRDYTSTDLIPADMDMDMDMDTLLSLPS